MILEVVAFNLESALIAAKSGAHRIEICDNYYEGGTTPSLGIVEVLKERTDIPIVVMIRPRGGDFLYNEDAVNTMIKDIRRFREIGCEGIVVGCLKNDGTIDENLLSQFVEAAGSMDVHFNRAFDRVKDQFASLETLARSGCKRVLTSGGRSLALDGVGRLKELVIAAGNKIKIIAGGGIDSNALPTIFKSGIDEFHTPARRMEKGDMQWINEDMNEALEYPVTDEKEISKMLKFLKERN